MVSFLVYSMWLPLLYTRSYSASELTVSFETIVSFFGVTDSVAQLQEKPDVIYCVINTDLCEATSYLCQVSS